MQNMSITQGAPEAGHRPSTSPEPSQPPRGFARVPLWARILVPAVLVTGAAAAMTVAFAGSQPGDPIETAESVCHDAVQHELESRDVVDIEVSRTFEVTRAGTDAYRATGAAVFEDADGSTHHADVRCTVRVEDGSMRATGIRIQD